MAAPPLIALKSATLAFAERTLFDGIDVALTPGDRASLIGRNGSGKSSLMGVLAGRVALDAGERFVQPGAHLAELGQEPDLPADTNLAEAVAAGLPADRAEETYRAEAMLEAVGLDPARTTAALSGGEARRAALARALVGEPDILLLDEPTNHLDLPTIEWIEARLSAFRGALLVISHDRAFLERVSTRMLWLDRGRMHVTDRGFAAFEDWAEELREAEDKAADRLDKRIAAETKWLREGLTARRKRNQGRVRRLTAMRAERRERVGRTGAAALAVAESASGKLVLEAEGLVKSVSGPDGPKRLIDGFSTRIMRGDRIGVVGPNGAGKTTLVRLLMGALPPDAGSLRLGVGVEPVYFEQSRESLAPESTVRDVLAPQGGDRIRVGERDVHLATYLKDYLFDPSRLDSPIRSLSGGERNRLQLARLFARPANLLVLDEPTNDLDMETLDVLEDVLGDYAGTLILVSHDRDFLDRLVTSVIAVEGGGVVREYVGGFWDYRRQAEAERRAAAPA
ncbi:MAG: ABC-F family ATP-binding cassette domain-containing protein, partial [Azospirillaceae bacterium]